MTYYHYIGFFVLFILVCSSGYSIQKAISSHRYSITRRVWLYFFYVSSAFGLSISGFLSYTLF